MKLTHIFYIFNYQVYFKHWSLYFVRLCKEHIYNDFIYLYILIYFVLNLQIFYLLLYRKRIIMQFSFDSWAAWFGCICIIISKLFPYFTKFISFWLHISDIYIIQVELCAPVTHMHYNDLYKWQFIVYLLLGYVTLFYYL